MPDNRSGVSCETRARLTAFVELLTKWNATVNLIAPSSLAQVWVRHIDDSLRLAPYMTGVPRAADLGSGAGFPGLVLSIATGTEYLLIESDHRKASFLREAIRLTAAPASVHIGRVEHFHAETFDVVTCRAFAPLSHLVSLSRHLLKPMGRYLLLKNDDGGTEIEDARRLHRFSRLHNHDGVLEIGLPPDRHP